MTSANFRGIALSGAGVTAGALCTPPVAASAPAAGATVNAAAITASRDVLVDVERIGICAYGVS